MAFTIHLKPSNHEFIVARGETILEAALRFGLSVRCSCTTGTCGTCKAKLISGEVGEVLHFDYVFSEAERRDRTILMCRTMAASDMVIEATETTGVADIPHQQLTAVVSKLDPVTDDVMVMEVRTPRSQTLRFMAGQYVTIDIDGIAKSGRSIASCPCNGMILQFHIRKTPGDRFAESVFSSLKPRQPVIVEGPFGEFVFDEESARPSVFIACETGFAPIKSVIEHAIALEFEPPMRLYWIASNARGHYQANFCRSWQDALDTFSFTPLVGDANMPEACAGLDIDWSALSDLQKGMLQAAAAVVADCPDLSGHDVYMNGPPPITSAATQLLLRHRLPADRLFIDRLALF